MSKEKKWRFFFPDEGEDEGDALTVSRLVFDAKDVAYWAVEYSYKRSNGLEHGEREFTVVVISPEGKQTTFKAWSETTIEHYVTERRYDD